MNSFLSSFSNPFNKDQQDTSSTQKRQSLAAVKKRNKHHYKSNSIVIPKTSHSDILEKPRKVVTSIYSYLVNSISKWSGLNKEAQNKGAVSVKKHLVQSRVQRRSFNLKYIRIQPLEETVDPRMEGEREEKNDSIETIEDEEYTPIKLKVSNIDSIRLMNDKEKQTDSIEHLIQNYKISLSLSEQIHKEDLEKSIKLQQQRILSPTRSLSSSFSGHHQKWTNESEDDKAYEKRLSSSYTEKRQTSDLFNMSPIKSMDTSNSINTSMGDGYNELKLTDLNESTPNETFYGMIKQTTSNLIQSLRPRFSELLIDKKQPIDTVREQMDASRREFINDETKELMVKLEAIHKNNKYNILRLINERIEAEKNKKPEARDPTSEEETLIHRAMKGADDEELISKIGTLPVLRKDIQTLQHGRWVNDEVINFYIEMMKLRQQEDPSRYPKCIFFNTFFYFLLCNTNGTYNYDRVKKWTNSVDIFTLDKVLVPVHLGNHWCMAVINMAEKQIEYYDSLRGENRECTGKLKRYLTDEMKNRKKEGVINVNDFKELFPKDIPNQKNGYDCGVFLSKFMDYTARGLLLSFTQKDITLYRRLMIVEIINKKLFK